MKNSFRTFTALALPTLWPGRPRSRRSACANARTTCGGNAPKSGRRSDSFKFGWSRGRRRWVPKKHFARGTLLAGGQPGVLTKIQTSRPVPQPEECRCTWSAFRAVSAMQGLPGS
jgi:hypothetical protein